MFRKPIAIRPLDPRQVREHEVAALGPRIGDGELVVDGTEAMDFGLHVAHGVGPEVVGVGLLEGDGGGFLQRGETDE